MAVRRVVTAAMRVVMEAMGASAVNLEGSVVVVRVMAARAEVDEAKVAEGGAMAEAA